MQSAIVNLDPLRKLLRDNKSAIRKALELFVETTEEDMKTIGEHISNKKFVEASRIAHSLKSRFVYLGNDDTIYKVRTLESLLKSFKTDTETEIENLFFELNTMIETCLSELRVEINALQD